MGLRNNLYRKVLDDFDQGILIMEKNGKIVYWNNTAKEITGYNPTEIMGKNCSNNLIRHYDYYGNCYCDKVCPIVRTYIDGKSRNLSAVILHKSGKKIPILLNVFPLLDDEGEIMAMVETFRVDTEYSMNSLDEEFYRHPDLLDKDTNIPGRAFIENFVSEKIKETTIKNSTFGLIMMKIVKPNGEVFSEDDEKVISDILKRAKKSLRSMDVIGKWEEREFLIVISNLKSDTIQIITQRIRDGALKLTSEENMQICFASTDKIDYPGIEELVFSLEKKCVSEIVR